MDVSGRPEAIRAALTYGRLALFAGACAVYVVVRYVVFPRRRAGSPNGPLNGPLNGSQRGPTAALLDPLDDVVAKR